MRKNTRSPNRTTMTSSFRKSFPKPITNNQSRIIIENANGNVEIKIRLFKNENETTTATTTTDTDTTNMTLAST